MERPNIFSHTSYDSYLKDFFEYKKSQSTYFSYGSCAKKLGLSGSGTLVNFVQGKRTPSPEASKKLSEFIGFTEYEQDYWNTLIEAAQSSKSKMVGALVQNKLKNLKPRHQFRQISLDMFRKVSTPLTYAIRELVNLKDFQENFAWIQKRLSSSFNVHVYDVEKKMALLLKEGLLARDENGKLIQSEQVYETPTEAAAECTKLYHRQILKMADKAIDSVPSEEKHFSSTTLTISMEEIPHIKKMIEDFRRQTLNTFDKKQGDEVYQLNIQCIPVTRSHAEDSA